MAIEDIPSSGKWGDIAALLNAQCSGSFSFDEDGLNPLRLTATDQIVTGWVAAGSLDGIAEANGEFSLSKRAKYDYTLSRIYENEDTNPADIVVVTLTVQTSVVDGVWVDTFTASSNLGAATSNAEPSVGAFCDPFQPDIEAGTKARLLVRAEDGTGVDPENCYLKRCRFAIKAFAPYPA